MLFGHSLYRAGWLVLTSVLLGLLVSCSGASASSAGGLLPGSMAGGKPVGMFFFISSSDFNNQRVYYFMPAGQVYLDPTDFSAAALAALPPAQRGTYAVSGKQMTIKWAQRQHHHRQLPRRPNGL